MYVYNENFVIYWKACAVSLATVTVTHCVVPSTNTRMPSYFQLRCWNSRTLKNKSHFQWNTFGATASSKFLCRDEGGDLTDVDVLLCTYTHPSDVASGANLLQSGV